MANVGSRSWPTKRATDGIGGWPVNAGTPTIQGWPRPPDSSSGTLAGEILKDAVFRIDAADHQRSGSPAKVVRNLGTGGSVLDCRTGSTSVPDTNDPLFLPVQDRAYVYLPGTSNISTPDEAAFAITDLDYSVRIALDTYRPSTANDLGGKWGAAGSRGWVVGVASSGTVGTVTLTWSNDGTATTTATSTVALPASTTDIWIRVKLDVDNGSGNNVTTFYTADGVVEPTSWTQLGDPVTKTGTTSIYNNTGRPITIGSTSGSIAGKFYRQVLKNGIDGTTVLDVDTSVLTTGAATSFTAVTGQTVTINRATSGRKTVVVPSSERKLVDAGNVYLPGVAGNYLSVPDEAALRITGDLTLTARIALDDWTPGTVSYVISKASTNQNDTYALGVTTGGLLTFLWTDASNVTTTSNSTTAIPVSDGTAIWIRSVLDADNGSGQNTVTFYVASDSNVVPTSWTQLGNVVTNSGTATIRTNSISAIFGMLRTSSGSAVFGRVFRILIGSGIHTSSTTVLDIDTSIAPTNFTPGYASAFPAVTGQTVTLNSTAGSAMRVNGERRASGGPVWLFGTDDYMEVPMSATGSKLLDFGPNDDYTTLIVMRQPSYTTFQALLTKGVNTGTGYYTRNGGATPAVPLSAAQDDTGFSAQATGPTMVAGSLTSLLSTRSRSAKRLTLFTNGLSGTSTADASYSTSNSFPLRIGRYSATGTSYADMELMSAAIWRRALSTAELATLTTYFSNRYA